MNKEIMTQLGFGDQVTRFEHHQCATCGKAIDMATFKDEISRREYRISGMCQVCQDGIFDSPDNSGEA